MHRKHRKHRKHRNPNGTGSIWWLLITVILLSGIVGVLIPVMSGGLPRGRGATQISPTPTNSQPLVIRAETPAVLAEAAGISDGTVGQSSKSTPVVTTAANIVSSTPMATSPVLAPSADWLAVGEALQVATPSPTPAVVQSTLIVSSTAAVVQLNASSVPASMSSPVATTTLVSAAKPALSAKPTRSSQRLPAPVPQTIAAKEAPPAAALVVTPELLNPAPDARLSGVAVFKWRPSVPLEKGLAYEIVVWSPEQDPNQAWGIAPTTLGTSLEMNLDELFKSGRFREGSLYWTVLLVQQEPYTRLTAPTNSPRRYLVYTLPDSSSEPVFQLPLNSSP